MARFPLLVISLLSVLGCALVSGCSSDVPTTADVSVGAKDMTSSAIYKAKLILDVYEKLPQGTRQTALDHNARALADLKVAVASDAATKQRMESLGLTAH